MSTDGGTAGGRIVVGVDGSDSSKAALEWALRQAVLTGAAVEAVVAWHFPNFVGGMPYAPIAVMDLPNYAELAAEVLDEVLRTTVPPDSRVKVSSIVREGNAAQVLIDIAEDADLLVVGSRGHGGFAEALLGSVSQHCVHHARCPVVIIRDEAGR